MAERESPEEAQPVTGLGQVFVQEFARELAYLTVEGAKRAAPIVGAFVQRQLATARARRDAKRNR